MLGQMETELYCLKWNDHQSNILDAFGTLLSDEALCDVTIACDGLSLKAHKLVLSASSTFFHNLFIENPCTHPIIIIPDLKYIDMKALVDFMYHGQVSVAENQLSTILKAAENLKIKGLGEHSVNSNKCVSPALQARPSKLHKSSFFKNSEHCLDEGTSKGQSGFHDDNNLFAEESRLSCDLQSESNITDSSEIDKTNASSDEHNDQLDLSGTVDAQSEIMPSKLMEQSMITEGVFQEKSFLDNPIASPEEGNESDGYDSVRINLPENLHQSDLHSSDIPFNQGFHCLLKDSSVCADDQLTVEMADNNYNDEGLLVCKDEYSVKTQGPSSVISENLSGTQRTLFKGPKRGRKPGSRLCVLCKHVFNSESDFKSHMDGHRSGSVSSNTDSEKLPQLLDLVDPPLVSEKNLLKLPLLCSTCNYVMTTLSDAQSHLSTNPQCRTSQFKCHLCPKIFIWPATLMKHFREQHEGPGGTTRVTRRMWFFCDVCKKPLLSKHALSLHRSKFHGLSFHPTAHESLESVMKCKRGRKQGTRVCRFCKRTFMTAIDYHNHLQTFHKNLSSSDGALETSLDLNESVSSIENESNSAQGGFLRM